MEAETFVRKCVDYAPDLVLLNFNTNDYDVPEFMRRQTDLSTLRRSYLFDLAYSVYAGIMGVDQQLAGLYDNYRAPKGYPAARLDEDPAMPDEYRYMVCAEGVGRALEHVTAHGDEQGTP